MFIQILIDEAEGAEVRKGDLFPTVDPSEVRDKCYGPYGEGDYVLTAPGTAGHDRVNEFGGWAFKMVNRGRTWDYVEPWWT